MIKRDELVARLERELQVSKFQDYCPNGLQVEGREQVRRLVSGVTACQALLDAAVIEQADALLVHHGYFWRGEDERIRGIKRQRLHTLLRHEINLFAYHLPLDAHPTLGNNATLGRVLDLLTTGTLQPDNPLAIGLSGELPERMTAAEFANYVEDRLGREVLHIGDPGDEIETLGWCTGAAQGMIQQAQALGVDAYLSGEISEPTVHFARETGIHYFACGHHATERYGVQAVGDWLAAEYGIEHIFIDIDNPV